LPTPTSTRNRELLKKINEVYSQVFSPDEERYRKQIRDYHRRFLEDEC